MRASRETKAGMPSPTFNHATTGVVPRPSPLLSSSFTPFYPRSQQQLYHPQSGYVGSLDRGCETSIQHSDDVDAHFSSWSHVRDSKFYDQQYYANLYEAPWVPNGGTAWDDGAWQQWGDSVEYAYAEEDTGESANHFSDSLSYYGESPTLEQDFSALTLSNTTSVPVLFPNKTQFLNCNVNEGLEADLKIPSSARGTSVIPNVGHSVIMPEQASCASKQLTESSLSDFQGLDEKAGSGYGQGPTKVERKEVARTFTEGKLDTNPSASQVSVQISSGFGSPAVELKMTTDVVENVQAQKESNVLFNASYNLSKKHGSADAIDASHLISATSDTKESITNPISKPSAFSPPTDINQKEAQSMKGVTQQTSRESGNEHCQSMPLPKAVDSQSLDQVNDIEELHPEKASIQPDHAGLCSNGPHRLVTCIHNLSKVLLSSQSKTSINAPTSSDCLVLEDTICMLSHRLFQYAAIEVNACQDPNLQQEPQNSSDSTKGFVEPFANMKPPFSFKRDFQHELSQDAPKLTAACSMEVDKQSSNLMVQLQVSQEELKVLRDDLQNLQEQLEYERVESNATVAIYKDLWSEAQEALKASKSEIKEIRTELAGLKQELRNVKLSGRGDGECEIAIVDEVLKQKENSDIVTSSSQGAMASDLPRASTKNGNSLHFCGSLGNASKVSTGYLETGIVSNCHSTETSSAKLEKEESNHGYQVTLKPSSKICMSFTGKSTLNDTVAPPINLENDVARRLSMLLSRQGLDLNKSFTESCVEWPSGSPSSNLPGEDKAMPLHKNYPVWSEASYDNNRSGCSIPNTSCRRRNVSEEEEEGGLYGLIERELNDGGGMGMAELKEGINQEDEVEIICFKPGIADCNFSCLKGEPEWEDVVVNALDDDTSARQELSGLDLRMDKK